MNFLSETENGHVQLELKYCERCGGLFLRPQADERVHCEECTTHLAAIPHLAESSIPKTRGARLAMGPKRRKGDLQGRAQIHSLEAVSLEVCI